MGKRGRAPRALGSQLLDGKYEIDQLTECWNWVGYLTVWGYGQVHFNGRAHQVHRISAAIHLGLDLESKVQANHKCNNKKCINPSHLYIGTQKQNVWDSISAGTKTKPPNRWK